MATGIDFVEETDFSANFLSTWLVRSQIARLLLVVVFFAPE
jgi:hypothetical protein